MIKNSAAELIDVLDVLPEPHILITSDGCIQAANMAARRELAPNGEIVGSFLPHLCLDPPEKISTYLVRCARSRSAQLGTFTFRHDNKGSAAYRCEGGVAIPGKNGTPTIILMRCRENVSAVRNFLSLNDEIARLSALSRRLARTQQQLARALDTQRALYRELQHRVKNNLQILISILTLSASREADDRVRAKLDDTRDRVKAIAAAHAALFNEAAGEAVDAVELARHVTEELTKAFGNPGITASVEDAAIRIPGDAALTVAMIVNELVSNSFKYAFPNRDGGTIEVAVKPDRERNILIVVADNGIGISSLRSEKHGFGFECVRTLAAGFDGRLEIDTGATGTRIQVTLYDIGS